MSSLEFVNVGGTQVGIAWEYTGGLDGDVEGSGIGLGHNSGGSDTTLVGALVGFGAVAGTGPQQSNVEPTLFTEGDWLSLYANVFGHAPQLIAGPRQWPHIEPETPPTLPGEWTYTNAAFPAIEGPFVTGFVVTINLTTIHCVWDDFTGAAKYRLQFRRDTDTAYLELTLQDQGSPGQQSFDLNDWQDDGRFAPAQNYVWRIRAE